MKIAIIQRFLPSCSRGGVGHFTHGLANSLVRRGHSVTVFSRDKAPSDASYDVFQVAPGRKKNQWDFFWFPFDLRACDFSSFDIVHAQGDEQFIHHKVPVIRTMHGSAWTEAWYNGIVGFSPKHFFMHLYFYFWEFIAHLRADKVVGVSRDTIRYYWRIHDVIGNGVETRLFRTSSIEKSKIPLILFVGQLKSRKRGDFLLDIFRHQIKPAIPDSERWLVCTEMIIEEGVRCFNNPSTEELAGLFAKAWVFCLPSSYEGFGRPYIEAMAAGTPVVATPNPGAREILAEGKYGCLSSLSMLGQNLIGLLKDEKKRNAYQSVGYKRAQDYDWGVITAQYEQAYVALTGR